MANSNGFGAGGAEAQAHDGPVDGDRARGRQHGRLGHLPAARHAGRHRRPDLDARLGLHRRRRDAAGARVRQPRPRAAAHRRPVRLRARARSATSSASRRPGATGSPSGPATPRSPSRSSATSTVFWPGVGDNNLLGALVGIGADLAADGHQHPRRARGRRRAGRHDGPEVRPAGRHRHRRAVLHRRRQLRAVRAARREPQPALDDRGAHAVGVHRPRVGDRAGRGGQGSRAHDPARDDHRHRSSRRCSTSSPRSRSWASSRPTSSPARRARSPTRPASSSAAAGTR